MRVRDVGGQEYVSRGGHKLAGALDAFAPAGLRVAGRRCLDAGASTGGFTDVLLRRGAAEVVAVDVGYGQLAWSLRNDSRVTVLERTNVRSLTPEAIGGPADLTVADLSFISLRLVLPALVACTAADGDLVPMVKPQFEVGRERGGRGRRGARARSFGPRRCSRWPPRPRAWGWASRAWSRARCRGRRATSSSSCGCGEARRRRTRRRSGR